VLSALISIWPVKSDSLPRIARSLAQRVNGFCKMDRKTRLRTRANTLRGQLELTLIDEINP
jgi:hypothetical protein